MDEVYSKSPLTGTWYRVTEWDEVGDNGKIIAREKEEVSREDVPDRWVQAIENNMDAIASDTSTEGSR